MENQSQEDEISLGESTLCRLCAEDNTNGELLFGSEDEPDLSSMINRYLPLKVYDDGKLPRTICPGCNIQLEATIQFFELLIDGQRKLRELYKSQTEQRSEFNQSSESFEDSLKMETLNEGSSEEMMSQQLFLKMAPDGSMYAQEHEISLQMDGQDKPRKKRGRPPKIHSEEDKIQETLETMNEENEEKLEEIEDVDENGRRRRRRKVPKRFSEAVQGKELERIFKEEGVIDEEDDDEGFEHEIEEFEEESNPILASDSNDEVIGHLESEEGRDLGELVVVNRNRGRGRPKMRQKMAGFTCNICGQRFHQRSKYAIHMSLHKEVKMECSECSKQFLSHDSFKLHQKVTGHDVEGSKETEQIQRVQKIPEKMIAHIREELPDVPAQLPEDLGIKMETLPNDNLPDESKENDINYECNHCGSHFDSKEVLEKHIKDNHNDKYMCNICDKVFSFRTSLNSHMASHDVGKLERGYKCDICGRKFNHPSSMVYHREAEHNDGKKFVCNKCNKSFKHKQLLQRHQIVHSKDRPYACQSCNASFKSKANLINHQSTHTGEKKYTCEICNQHFAHKTSLTLHYRWHSGHKPFKCEVCNKSFSQNGNLQEHMRIHTGEKPYSCDHCGRKFTTSSQFKLHVKRHTGERPWKCEFCAKSFLHKDTWKCHVRRHKGERPFQCVHCGRDFTEQWALKKHLRLHTGEKPYACNVCGKKFADCSNLTKHRKIHKDTTVTISDLKTANGDLWQIIPSNQEGENSSLGDNVTQIISTEEGSEDGVPQIIYVSYQDPDDPNQSRTLHLGMFDKDADADADADVPPLQSIMEGGNILKHAQSLDLNDPSLQLQVTDDEGNMIPLSAQVARQLVSHLNDGQIRMVSHLDHLGINHQSIAIEPDSCLNQVQEVLGTDADMSETPEMLDDGQGMEIITNDGQKLRIVAPYYGDSSELASEYLTIV